MKQGAPAVFGILGARRSVMRLGRYADRRSPVFDLQGQAPVPEGPSQEHLTAAANFDGLLDDFVEHLPNAEFRFETALLIETGLPAQPGYAGADQRDLLPFAVDGEGDGFLPATRS